MRHSIVLFRYVVSATFACGVGLSQAAADPYSVIYKFQRPIDGVHPYSGVAADTDGTLYGTTIGGGSARDCGTVFSLTKSAGTEWTHKVIHVMGKETTECHPAVTPIINGDFIYSGTFGTYNSPDGGSIFRTAKSGAGYRTLHLFNKLEESNNQQIRLTAGPDSALVGINFYGGQVTNCGPNQEPDGQGVLFKLRETASSFDVLHDFGRVGSGSYPTSLAFGPDGAIYGTTLLRCQEEAKNFKGGIVFRKSSSGYSVLYAFPGYNRSVVRPSGQIAIGPDGTIYGTTDENPKYQPFAWSLKPGAAGQPWTFTKIYEFPFAPTSAYAVGLIRDSAGNLYGVIPAPYKATLYRLSPPKSGNNWTFTSLHTFQTTTDDPNSSLLLYDGSIYGTTYYGGNMSQKDTLGFGTVFRYALP